MTHLPIPTPTAAPAAPRIRLVEAAPPTPRARVAFTDLDRAALRPLLTEEGSEGVVRLAEELADALCTDSDGARLRTLSRLLAIEATEFRVMTALLGQHVAKRDAAGADLLADHLDRSARRLGSLAAAHRAETRARGVVTAAGHFDGELTVSCEVER